MAETSAATETRWFRAVYTSLTVERRAEAHVFFYAYNSSKPLAVSAVYDSATDP